MFLSKIFHNRFFLKHSKKIFSIYVTCMLLTSLVPMDIKGNQTSFWAGLDPSVQNILHVPMFILLVFLFNNVLEGIELGRRQAVFLMLGATMFLAVLMEAIQAVVPGRYPSLGDMFLNLAGVVLGICLVLRFPSKRVLGAASN